MTCWPRWAPLTKSTKKVHFSLLRPADGIAREELLPEIVAAGHKRTDQAVAIAQTSPQIGQQLIRQGPIGYIRERQGGILQGVSLQADLITSNHYFNHHAVPLYI